MHKFLWLMGSLGLGFAWLTMPLWGQDATLPSTFPTPSVETPLDLSPTDSPIPEATATFTPEMTAEVTSEASSVLSTIAATPAASLTPTPAPTSAWVLHEVSGYLYYQNSTHAQHSGIEIEIFTDSRQLVSSTVTDINGMYHLSVPSEIPFWFVADAPLHRENAVRVLPGEALPVLVLQGGDLNDDECITLDDLQLFSQPLITTDINGDKQTNIADIAILTGNLQLFCEVFARTLPPTWTPTATNTPDHLSIPTNTLVLSSPTTTETPMLATTTPEQVLPSTTPTLTETATEWLPTETATTFSESTPEAEFTAETQHG